MVHMSRAAELLGHNALAFAAVVVLEVAPAVPPHPPMEGALVVPVARAVVLLYAMAPH